MAKPVNLNALLKKAKARTETKKQNEDRLLFGTGLTKRKLEQVSRAEEKQSQRVMEIENLDISDEIAVGDLPTTLMDSNIILDQYQEHARKAISQEQVAVVIGAAGCGKTTLAKTIIAEAEPFIPLIDLNTTKTLREQEVSSSETGLALAIGSFMGKAAQNIKRALPESYHKYVDTLHGLLRFQPTIEEVENPETGEWIEKRVFRPYFNASNKLPYKFILLDEAGTIPIYLFNCLIDAIEDDCRIILMGDINQLPPVQGASVLAHAMTKWPTFALEQIHRQAEGNPIIENAHRILSGKMPIADPERFILIDLPMDGIMAANKILTVVKKLKAIGKYDAMRDITIVPQNKGALGQISLNQKLVQIFNPVKKVNDIPINPKIIIKAGYHKVILAIGDKVMITANERKLGLTNGMIGVIKSLKPNPNFRGDHLENMNNGGNEGDLNLDDFDLVDQIDQMDEKEKQEIEEDENERQASHILEIQFQNMKDTVEFSTAGAFKKIVHSYAITCHKAQGGEYHTVITGIHSSNGVMLCREWLYTAITRAQEKIILCCNQKGLHASIHNQRLKGNSVEQKIKHFVHLELMNEKKGGEKPHLWEPRKFNAVIEINS